MSHTPQKFITVPLLVEAMEFTGDNWPAIKAFSNNVISCNRAFTYLTLGDTIINRGGFVVKASGKISLRTAEQFEAQYTPFKEELKDYPVEIINP